MWARMQMHNGYYILVAKSRVDDCFELKYVDYQTLAHLSYSSYMCWISLPAAVAFVECLSIKLCLHMHACMHSKKELC